MANLTEQQKVQTLYKIIGDRGFYVSTNFDVFTKPPEEVALASGAGYKIPLAQVGSRVYSSPLLFATLTSLLSHGTMLITGAPGIGKTTGAEFAGHFFSNTPLEDILAAEIQGHPQLTEEKMVASFDIGKLVNTGERVVIPNKFLQCPVKILDEGTRTPPDVLSIIMRLVDTGKAVYGGQLLTAKPGPLFVTANYADEGTFQFTPPFLDRFDVAVMVTSPQSWDLTKIRERGDEKLNGNGIEELLKIPENLKLDTDKIRNEIKSMSHEAENDIDKVGSFADFLYASLRYSEAASHSLVRSTKGNAWQVNQNNAPPGHYTDSPFIYTVNELSVRTVKALHRYARAYAWLNGKSEVELEDVKTIAPYLLWHKLQPTSKALAEDPVYANDRIAFAQDLIGKVEAEYTEMIGSETLKIYGAALNFLITSKHKNKTLNPDQLRTVARNAIRKLGDVDKPYAIMLASHIAAEYNSRINGQE